MYLTEIVSWPDAKTACEALGGHLATSTSAEKNAFLVSLINSNSWLGGYYEKTESVWKWVTGEDWSYTNWNSGEPNNMNGTALVAVEIYSSDSNQGRWNDAYQTGSAKYAYICEWDYDMRKERGAWLSNILNFGGNLVVGIQSNRKIAIQSDTWSLYEVSSVTMSADTWHHILLRIFDGEARVYLDGELAVSVDVAGIAITPEQLELGGYIGYMDEFVFKDGAGTGNPIVPTSAYETSTGSVSSNAPITRAVWTCEDLPEGLILSADGKISGRPTIAGTYTCAVQVTTNWGTATKNISIRVTE